MFIVFMLDNFQAVLVFEVAEPTVSLDARAQLYTRHNQSYFWSPNFLTKVIAYAN